MKINEAFEPGHRKITLTVLAMVGVVLLEKFGGGLTPDTRNFILSVLGIFTGGNVASKAIFATKEIKLAKAGVVERPFDPVDLKEPEQEVEFDDDRLQGLENFINRMNEGVLSKFNQIDQALALQAENTNRLIEMINKKK